MRMDGGHGWPRAVLAAAASLLVLAGCGASANGPTASTTRTPEVVATSPTATRDPLDQCTEQLEYWADAILADFDDPGYDYQEMGLSSAKYIELLAVVEAARTEMADRPLPEGWLHDQITDACVRILAAPVPTSDEPGWP
jgi:hypothetical protein